MADGVEVGRAFVSIASEVNAAAIARQGQAAAAAFVKGFSGVANAGLATIESKAAAATRGLGFVATAGTRAFSAIATSASGAQSVINSVYSGLTRIGGAAGAVGLALPRALGMASEAARGLSNEIGLSAFRLQMMGGVLAATITAPVLAATKAIVTFGLTTAMSLENAEVALSALLPPGYNVEALLGRLKKLAISSPVFAIDQLEDFTKRLVGATVPIDKTERILDALNKVMITFGATGAGASEVLLGVQQVFQKGKVSSEELTRQISQQLPIWALLSQASGLTQAELIEMTVAGEFTSEMFGEMLIKVGRLPQIMKGAAGGVTTLSARWSILVEAFQQTIGTELLKLFPEIKNQLDRLQPTIDEFTAFVVNQIPKLTEVLVRMVDTLFDLRRRFDELDAPTQRLLIQIAKFAPVAGPALLIIGALASSLSALLGLLAFAINPVAVFTAAVVYGFTYMLKTSDTFRRDITAFKNVFVASFRQEMPAATRDFVAVVKNELLPALEELARALGFTSLLNLAGWLGQHIPRLLGAAARQMVKTVELITRAVRFLTAEWVKLDDQMQRNIIRFGLLALAMIPLLPLIAGVFGALANIARVLAFLTSPIGLLLIGLAALAYGIKYLWDTSAEFRSGITKFAAAFQRSWAREMPAAIAAFKAAVVSDLLPALEGLARALGFTGWDSFAVFLGTVIPKMMARAVRAITMAVGLLSDGIRYLTKIWSGLSDETQKTIIKMAGIGLLLLPLLPILLATGAALFGITGALIGLGAAVAASVFGVLRAALGAVVGLVRLLLGGVLGLAGSLLSLNVLLTVGVVAALAAAAYGLYVLWQNSEIFRESVKAFGDGFKAAWTDKVLPAVAELRRVFKDELLPAVLELGRAFGIDTWQEFSFWLGTLLPRSLGYAIEVFSRAVSIIAGAISWFAEKWSALDDTQKENILTMAKWAAGTAVIIFAARAVGGALLGMFGPWGLLIIGAVALFKYFWESSTPFREGILAFGDSFSASWKANVIPALKAFGETFKTTMWPALKDLAHALGVPEFATFKDFMSWLGTRLPELIATAIGKLEEFTLKVVPWIEKLTDKWNSLDEKQKDTLKTIAGVGLLAAPFAGDAASLAGSIGKLIVHNPGLGILALAIAAVGLAFKEMWDNSKDFREGIEAFKETFKISWGDHVPAAADRLKAAFKDRLLPALEDFARALGFDSFKSLGEYLGTTLPELVAKGIDALATAVDKLAGGVETVTGHAGDIKKWWDEDIKPVFEGIRDFLAGVGEGLEKMWPKIEEAGLKVKQLFDTQLKPALDDFLKSTGYNSWKEFGDDIGRVLGIMLLTLIAMAALDVVIATAILKLATAMVEGAKFIADGFDQYIGEDFWTWFSEGWTQMFRELEPASNSMGEAGKKIGETYRKTWDDVVRYGGPVVDWLGKAADWIAEKFVIGLQKIGEWFAWLGQKFWRGLQDIAGWVYNLWGYFNQFSDGLTAIFKGVIRYIIALINQLIIAPYNWLAGFVPGLRHSPDIPMPFESGSFDSGNTGAGASMALAAGGPVVGPGTKTSDSILASLSNGEFVMNAAAVDFWGSNFMSAVNGMNPSRVSAATQGSDTMQPAQAERVILADIYLDGEPFQRNIKAAIGANNRMIIDAGRTGRRA